MSGHARRIKAVLFDLDGTLIDSAPDLAGAANDMRVARGLPELPLEHFRPMVGSGARGMLHRALDMDPQHDQFAAAREEFLGRYESRMTRQTRVFPDMLQVLLDMQVRALPWAIVTNKATRFSEPLVRALGLHLQATTLVCGDTTPHAKPHPEPLFEAARRLKVDPKRCIYVGDDHRDIVAGQAAGMGTVAATYGYLGSVDTAQWGAHVSIAAPKDLLLYI